MSKSLEVLFTPADFEALRHRDLTKTVCVVFDVLRATSSMITALANGAEALVPVGEISEALALKRLDPELLLAGERDGVLITAEVSGGVAFDLGNSPREFTAEKIKGRRIAITTTNGTRALRACANARRLFVGSLLNLSATASAVGKSGAEQLLIICSGTYEQAAYEDVLGAGALCQALSGLFGFEDIADSARMAHVLYTRVAGNLAAALGTSRNGRRLLGRAQFAEDVAFCARIDEFPLVVTMDREGLVRRVHQLSA